MSPFSGVWMVISVGAARDDAQPDVVERGVREFVDDAAGEVGRVVAVAKVRTQDVGEQMALERGAIVNAERSWHELAADVGEARVPETLAGFLSGSEVGYGRVLELGTRHRLHD